MNSPKVTIVVPVFNVKKYLPECLDSILKQTLPEIEVICGDGGSNDGSLEILQNYKEKDPRVKIISKEHSGYGQSLNDCMDVAKGEYIGIVESDDVIKPDMYEKLYNKAKELDLDWIKSDIYRYYSGKSPGKQLVRESIIDDADFYDTVLDPQIDHRPYKSGLRTWSGIYKTDFIKTYRIRHNETPGGSYQDAGFFLKTFYYAHKVYFMKDTFYMWRQDNPGSSIHYDPDKLVNKSLNEWKLNREYLESHKELSHMAYGCYNHRKFLSYRWTIQMSHGKSKKLAKEVARKELTEALKCNEVDMNFFEEYDWEEFNVLIDKGRLNNPVISKIKSLFR